MERRLELSVDPTVADASSLMSRSCEDFRRRGRGARRAMVLAIVLLWGFSTSPVVSEEPPGDGAPEETDPGTRPATVEAVDPQPGSASSPGEARGTVPDPGDSRSGADPVAEAAEPGLDRRSEIDRVVRDCWWNRPQVIAALTLETAQREQMDAVMKGYLEALYAPRDESLRRNPFRVALKRGDLDEATRVLDQRAQELAEETVREGRMMVAVLGHLSVDQREVLAQKFPQVFRARWLMTFGGGERGGRGAAAPRARRRSVDGPGGMQ